MGRGKYSWSYSFLQLLLFIILIWFGCPYKATWLAWIERPSAHESKPGEIGSLVFEDIDLSDEPYLEQLAVGLNAPAAFVGSVFVILRDWISPDQLTGAQNELISHVVTAAIIPLLWLFLIVEIKKVTNDAPKRSSPSVIYCGLTTIVVLGLIATLIIVSSLVPEGQPLYLFKILVLAWIATAIFIMLSRISRPIIKHSNLIRLMNLVAMAICIGNWFFIFLHTSVQYAWEWNVFSLLDLARFISLKMRTGLLYGHSHRIIAASACISGCVPLMVGLFGSLRPKAKALLPITIISSVVVLASVVAIYIGMVMLYSYDKRPIVRPDLGTYLTCTIVIIQILAGLLSRKGENQQD